MNTIKHVIFDFDGTCTQIPAIHEQFAEEYRRNFSDAMVAADPGGAREVTMDEWAAAQAVVRENSPREGWSVGGTPSAPVAADPYILADESAKLICRGRNLPPPSGSGLHSGAYHKFPAPLRPEARDVLREICNLGIAIHFVSNSSSKFVGERLDELLSSDLAVRKAISIESDAGKFFIRELSWGGSTALDGQLRARFDALPPSDGAAEVPFRRPIYLRRGSYFEAICRALGNEAAALENTIVCGDVWELDLAMPYHLGMQVHLVERAPPFKTYDYERARITSCGTRGTVSVDLNDLLGRITKTLSR